jgi:Pyruvate/2-oxoacid:ferredoxin oxidoreductase delta subunit
MAIRNIVKIDEEKCNGCGFCVKACAEGAIQLIDGKAKLVSEIYCDGLGACIGHCPQDAITIEQREADEFDEAATKKHLAETRTPREQPAFACPGMMAAVLSDMGQATEATEAVEGDVSSQLGQWPVQLKLVSPHAPYFAGSHLLIVADCVPFAMGDFHSRYLKDHTIAVGCPKLDDQQYYIEKLADIIKANNLSSISVLHMQVPCCSGLTYIASEAIKRSGVDADFEDVTISLKGGILKTETIKPQRP